MRSQHLLFPLISPAYAGDCTQSYFRTLLPSNATIRFATPVAANTVFQVPRDNIAYSTSPLLLHSACAVEINITSSPTSAFSFGLFLPDALEWNERFLAVGNGGFAGGVNYLDMAAGLGYGFAAMSTDTGHNSTSGDITWASGQEQKKLDWGYRAMHESIVAAKAVTTAYYGQKPSKSYYSGCSTGGRQGIREIQLHPESFDGVLAGAPAWWTSHLQTWTLKAGLNNLPLDSPGHIPSTLFPVIAKEVRRQCDGQDGLVDSIISDPEGCNFFAEALLCGSNNESACLTAPQIDTLYKIHHPYVETNDTFVFPGLELGSEEQWNVLLGGRAPNALGTQYVQNFVLNDPTWNYWDFNGSIVELADRIQPGNATAYDFDLSSFHAKGGKLLQYHGEADGLIPTGSSTYFYKQVLKTLKPKGIELDSWYRFFLVPGMQHCSGTPIDVGAPWFFAGSNQAGAVGSSPGAVYSVPGFSDARHDALLALMAWVEHGQAPDEIVATVWKNQTVLGDVLRQRPLCPYPKQAKWSGKGSADRAESWSCVGVGEIVNRRHYH